ncbi:4aaff5cb-c894-4478-a5b8-826e5280307f [Sclerotinia trifoliorum]|uniref:4aaff5cb-c894-4478-a5b8-826e5280307f n=1 Tax=Sclerotinia trifoliorum TaxID=28548 RepID=A0A8H2ZSJ6_9HELO|nr:4aaff5cb-c894-4478-a5b8-826e5280307f [Sclerotinia trifoliorum]
MLIQKFGKLLLPLTILAVQVFAQADKAKWDAVCKQKAGPQFSMQFDAAGKPTGQCVAPPITSCYWGPYTDPKDQKSKCCGKDKGTFSVDPVIKTEGACCVAPSVFSFDSATQKGDCCDVGKSYHADPKTLSGSCCQNSDDVYTCDCSCKPNPNPTCPKGDRRTFTAGGKKYILYCNLINHGTNDLGQAPADTMGDCMSRCSGISNCVRAIYAPSSKICYLRTHGNKDVPVTADGYDSAHLIEEPTTTQCPVCPSISPKPEPFPDKCPGADSKITIVGGVEYKVYCTVGHSASNPNLGVSSAKNFKECMEQCSAKAKPFCQGVNYYDDGNPTDNCVWASVWDSPPKGTAPAGGDFLCAIPTTQRT